MPVIRRAKTFSWILTIGIFGIWLTEINYNMIHATCFSPPRWGIEKNHLISLNCCCYSLVAFHLIFIRSGSSSEIIVNLNDTIVVSCKTYRSLGKTDARMCHSFLFCLTLPCAANRKSNSPSCETLSFLNDLCIVNLTSHCVGMYHAASQFRNIYKTYINI